ncbi:MAG: ABC transporter ATP-binding protein [Cyclobacteriaceae bacterium]
MKKNNTYLTTSSLNIGYKHLRTENVLFENLNLSLHGGRMICFMGPNGAGKSSLLRTLSGLQQPLSGKIDLFLPAGSAGSATQIAVVLTDRVNALNLTVEEVVTFGRYPYLGWDIRLTDSDKEIVRSSIRQIHLEPLLHKKLYELSDGQLQMVMIARALAQDTPIILLDEPTAHLDLNNRVEIMNLLRDLSRTTRKAILLATHELDLALQTADLIWLTGKKRNILTGLPEDLVLNGAFDEIFEFKGFDLKTGKVRHSRFRETHIQLLGDGAAYLWTRNALERTGFNVTGESSEISVSVVQDPLQIKWIVKKIDSITEADSIENLMNCL